MITSENEVNKTVFAVVERFKLENRYHSTVICSSLEEVEKLIQHYITTSLKYEVDVFEKKRNLRFLSMN